MGWCRRYLIKVRRSYPFCGMTTCVQDEEGGERLRKDQKLREKERE
jgi:hypothetical protein